MLMRQFLARFQECARRHAFDLVKRAHLASVSQRSVIIGVYRIAHQGVLIRCPFLVQVGCFAVYVKGSDGKHIIKRIITTGYCFCA